MLPVLEDLLTKGPHYRHEIVAAVADRFGLTEEERQQTLRSGEATVILSRVAWALAYLKQAKLVESPKRGMYQITELRPRLLDRLDGPGLPRGSLEGAQANLWTGLEEELLESVKSTSPASFEQLVVVGRPEIQKFPGALQGQRAKKGIVITTSDFSRDADDYAQRIESRIILSDGHRLTRLMFDFDVGANPRSNYTVKQFDSDSLEEM